MSVTITVPATTANLGPGFDCLGAALSLYNRFQFSLGSGAAEELQIEASGRDAERVATDATNLAYQAFCHFYQKIGQTPPPLHLSIHLEIPLARGLGSSATAIVAGLVGANELAGSPLTQADLMAMAIDLEGHPDNVVPALMGGCRLAATQPDATWTICEIPWYPEIVPVVVIPEFELSTAKARSVLPATYNRADAIFNAAHLGLLIRGLQTGDFDWLQTALQDRIHQPYRQALIPGYDAVQSAALQAGAYGLVISGAGPTLLALTPAAQAETIQTAMVRSWESAGIAASAQILPIERAEP
ncbi:MAG: homoserine kinase [Cyanobacteria bacterium RM1_2_2]|nr:homoserine kinase [Cyanobacteria bacterium RM1_2_2]